MRYAVLLLLVSLACDRTNGPGDLAGDAAGLIADLGGGGSGDAAGPDLASASDLAGPVECVNVRECAGRPLPQVVRACGAARWSCIAGRCTAECSSMSRTCYQDNRGCLSCDGRPAECPGSACVGPSLARGRIEDATCQRAFLNEIDSCFAGYLRLRDGMICTVQDLPTGAIREVVACGACQIQLVF